MIRPEMLHAVKLFLTVAQVAWLAALWRLKHVKGVTPPSWLVIVVALMLGINLGPADVSGEQAFVEAVRLTGLLYLVTTLLLLYTLWLEWQAWQVQKAAGRTPSWW